MKLYRIYVREDHTSDNDLRAYYALAENFTEAVALFDAQPIVMVELMGWTEGNQNIFVER